MGKRGPTPKPTALRLLDGDRKDRVNHSEPVPDRGDVLAPDWLPESARAVWDRLAPDLVRKAVLTPWDVDAFADLCSLVVLNRDALLELDRNGITCTAVDRVLADGTVTYRLSKNPAWQVARESTALITTLGGRFGLNPSDRASLSLDRGADGGSKGAERLLS